ncbi:hypothetical protein AB0A77_33910 [Streptomyces varsoviensis]|uniref:DUF7848 domain-containing protein n=1 Tax=Streptomyces varsoviensis TaxID=67373 RepID=UPI00341026CE
MSRAFRYTTWTVEQDPTARTEYSAECVTGENNDCGEMIRTGDPAWVKEWMRRHTQATGHNRYCRTVDEYVVLEPSDEAKGRQTIGEAVPSFDDQDPRADVENDTV